MKKIPALIALAVLILCSTPASGDGLLKMARKDAARLQKQGWTVKPGQMPLENQLDKSYRMGVECDADGEPKYIIGEASSVSKSYDAARMQAIGKAKVELAGMIGTQLTALTESTVSNNQISIDEATSINSAVQSSKSLISRKLGRTVIVVECFRQLEGDKVEVSIRLAYNARLALEEASEVVRTQLAGSGGASAGSLDKVIGAK